MVQPNLEYNPKKKSRVAKIIAQILSTLFTTAMIVGLIACFTTDAPRYIPYEEVNLYNTNYEDVYELKDITVVSKYASDEYIDYYLVLLPYQDEMVKVASLCCQNSYDFNINIRKQLNNKNAKLGDCMVSAGVTADYTDILYDNIEEDYHKAVEDLKSSGMKVVSTELSFDFACEASVTSFEEYRDSEKTDNNFLCVVFVFFAVLGITLMYFSFREKKDKQPLEQTYQASTQQGTYFDPDFDNRF